MRRILGKDRLRAETTWMMAGREVRDVFVLERCIDCVLVDGKMVRDAGLMSLCVKQKSHRARV